MDLNNLAKANSCPLQISPRPKGRGNKAGQQGAAIRAGQQGEAMKGASDKGFSPI
jgi:hypothetical protein